MLSDTNLTDAFVPVLSGRDNSIKSNSVAGLNNTTTRVPDVRRNFWGSASGPTNPGGHGDKITGPATFIPFLTQEP